MTRGRQMPPSDGRSNKLSARRNDGGSAKSAVIGPDPSLEDQYHTLSKKPEMNWALRKLVQTQIERNSAKIANNSSVNYNLSVEEFSEIAHLLSKWDKSAVTAFVADIKSGVLSKQYHQSTKQSSAPRSLHQGAKSPPGNLFYADRADRKEAAPKFIEKVYGGAGWLTGEFTRADLRKLDPAAAMGLANWERAHGRASLNLPTLKERNDRRISETPAPSKSEAVRAYDRERALRRKRPATTK